MKENKLTKNNPKSNPVTCKTCMYFDTKDVFCNDFCWMELHSLENDFTPCQKYCLDPTLTQSSPLQSL